MEEINKLYSDLEIMSDGIGVVRQGSVRVHDELTLLPTGKNVLVKSIQMHDNAVEEAMSPAWVGLAIKGIPAEEISRGDVVCLADNMKVSNSISLKFTENQFFKSELAENQTYMVSIGLQVKPAKVRHVAGLLEITLEKPVDYRMGETCVLLKPDSKGTRMVGKGMIQ
ncbi:MAG: EF-Tu/IF-2/RF-3 family GTPase [Nitrososphaerales archaeon]